jgi:LDH2 family malate/lactate/ureidoglycolate dehydrogenase
MAVLPNSRLYDSGTLQSWCTAIFEASGMPGKDAAVAASVLVRTSLRGIDTHGISRAPQYAESLLDGAINPKPDHGGEYRDGVLHYRGDRGLGQVIGAAAVHKAIEIAGKVPMVPCLMQQCGHLAALGAYALIAAEAGMFAFLCQSTTPLMGLPGWKGRGIGNNPLAFATPLPDSPPLVFDMASSVVARGNLRQAVREGTSIPEGWAIGPDGEPTTDAETGFAGAVLPVGGYKGMGIAMLVQCLAGSLIGSSIRLRDPGGSSEMGAFLLVINPQLAAGGIYAADTREWLDRFMQAAGPEGRYPGSRAAACEAERRRDGIPVAPGSLAQMRAVSERLGVPFNILV